MGRTSCFLPPQAAPFRECKSLFQFFTIFVGNVYILTMDCKNCDNKDTKECCKLDMGRGCKFCHCGEDTSAEAVPGCYKLNTNDWLEGMPEVFPDDIFEVRFKNTRKSYYKNVNDLPLEKGDVVAVEASPGHDIGIVSLTGDLVARQMRRVGFNPQNGEFKKIYRKAKSYDIEKWQEAIAMEHQTMIRSRQIAAELGLNMKIGDVEYQGDKIKAIFYYIADERVDFRELIKIFADQFRIRIEMKQIGARQEAGRIGGLGSCGRELCCASWISNFVSVTTNSARHQEISLNPQKLAGQCGKLKCCLVYEVDTYLDARKEIPRVNQPLQTLDADYYLVKTDILSRTMWFSPDPHSTTIMKPLSVDRVKEIMRLNSKGQKAEQLSIETVKAAEPTFANVVGEDSLTRFDKTGEQRGRDRSKGRRRPEGQSGEQRQGDAPRGGEQRRSGGDRQRDKQSQRPQDGEQRQGGGRNGGRGQGGNRNDKDGEQRQSGNRSRGQEGRRDRNDNRDGNRTERIENREGGQNPAERSENREGNQNRSERSENREGGQRSGGRGGRNRGNRDRGPRPQKDNNGSKEGGGNSNE